MGNYRVMECCLSSIYLQVASVQVFSSGGSLTCARVTDFPHDQLRLLNDALRLWEWCEGGKERERRMVGGKERKGGMVGGTEREGKDGGMDGVKERGGMVGGKERLERINSE